MGLSAKQRSILAEKNTGPIAERFQSVKLDPWHHFYRFKRKAKVNSGGVGSAYGIGQSSNQFWQSRQKVSN